MSMHGHCNCGAIQISIKRPEWSGLCHCLSCRRASGALAKPFLPCAPADLKVEGQPKMYLDMKGESGKGVKRFFCGACGSQLWSDNTLSELVYVCGGLFEPGSLPAPVAEIYTRSMEPWEKLHDGVKACPADE